MLYLSQKLFVKFLKDFQGFKLIYRIKVIWFPLCKKTVYVGAIMYKNLQAIYVLTANKHTNSYNSESRMKAVIAHKK
jgi:hypothetical protein